MECHRYQVAFNDGLGAEQQVEDALVEWHIHHVAFNLDVDGRGAAELQQVQHVQQVQQVQQA